MSEMNESREPNFLLGAFRTIFFSLFPFVFLPTAHSFPSVYSMSVFVFAFALTLCILVPIHEYVCQHPMFVISNGSIKTAGIRLGYTT